ncbi:hypothetical protein EI71_01579 [Anaeroplasma bactoclasticum]|jgi:hypothetical protein|uniref:Uncharacterized protein n=1 Tax=Anaeroplasma bactoclasticum TaxID=2088 RepID=A0A397QYE0_9MOLU|nr:hypothetical protein [Anaeroplasma bactoclasticum]RIA66530.1 hypothetical protein EI71_01579 [Anaeroplasma bactoclasticum]
MEETKNIFLNEDNLYLSLEYYRLKKDLEIIEERIRDNAPIDTNDEKNKLNKVWQDKVVNTIRKKNTNSLSEEKKKYMDQMDLFLNNNGNGYDKCEEELVSLVNEFFKNDASGEARIIFGIKLALNSEYKFFDEKTSLEKVSNLLFDNLTKLGEVLEELKKNYYAINKKKLNEFDKNVWKGLGIVLVSSLALGPIGTLASTWNKDVKEALNELTYAGEKTNTIALTVSAATLNIFLIGATAGVIGLSELRKDDVLKKEYRAITPDSLAMRYAIKATIIEEIKKKGDKEVLAKCLDDALTVLDNYRADQEYMMIVEGLDKEIASRKITISNNLVERLAEISK